LEGAHFDGDVPQLPFPLFIEDISQSLIIQAQFGRLLHQVSEKIRPLIILDPPFLCSFIFLLPFPLLPVVLFSY
jgi:hypothetical protein